MQTSHCRVSNRDLRSAAVRPIAGVLLVTAMGLALSACASMETPEWIDTASWFKDQTPEPRTEAAAATRLRADEAAEVAADQPFPKLATVPDRPDAMNASVRQRVAEGLVADRENARYTAEAVARLGYIALPPNDAPVAEQKAIDFAAAPPVPESEAVEVAAAPPVAEPEAVEVAAVPAVDAPMVEPNADGAMAIPPVEVATIYFASGSTALQPSDEAVLRDVAAMHEQLGGSLLLVGHASRGQITFDPLDTEVEKLGVSLYRALAVASMLAQLGVELDKVAIEGRGDNQPKYQEATPLGEAGNRRTVVYLLR